MLKIANQLQDSVNQLQGQMPLEFRVATVLFYMEKENRRSVRAFSTNKDDIERILFDHLRKHNLLDYMEGVNLGVMILGAINQTARKLKMDRDEKSDLTTDLITALITGRMSKTRKLSGGDLATKIKDMIKKGHGREDIPKLLNRAIYNNLSQFAEIFINHEQRKEHLDLNDGDDEGQTLEDALKAVRHDPDARIFLQKLHNKIMREHDEMIQAVWLGRLQDPSAGWGSLADVRLPEGDTVLERVQEAYEAKARANGRVPKKVHNAKSLYYLSNKIKEIALEYAGRR